MRIEQAQAHDEPDFTATLTASFADDPGLCWIWPDRDDRLSRLPYFFRAIVTGSLPGGTLSIPRQEMLLLSGLAPVTPPRTMRNSGLAWLTWSKLLNRGPSGRSR